MALKLTLTPGEKLVVNGAVLRNGERRTTLVVQNRAAILREKDILLPEQATTPMRRVYFAIMMLYLEDGEEGRLYQDFVDLMGGFMNALRSPPAMSECLNIMQLVHGRQYYKALIACRKLFPFEEARLSYVAQ
jgi:flagellar protein FlbT